MKKIVQFLTGVVLLSFALAGVPAHSAHAATTWHVTSLADGAANAADCNGPNCTLRDAVAAAGSGDTIDFSVTGLITLSQGQLVLNYGVSISGPGAGSLTIDGGNADRIFQVGNSAGNVSISGLTLTHGLQTAAHYEYNLGGGAILNLAHLTLDGMVITSNTLDCQATCLSLNADGGAIYSSAASSLTITNSILSNNFSQFGGALAMASGTATGDDLTLTNVTISGNQASTSVGFGGGIALYANHHATLTNVSVLNNTTAYVGGGMYIGTTPVSIAGSTFGSNQSGGDGAYGSGGAIYLDNNPGAALTVNNSTFTGNSGTLGGGAIYNAGATAGVYNSTFSGNSSTDASGGIGGGISDGFGSTLYLYNDTLSGNTAASGHGGALAIDADSVYLFNTILAGSLGGASDCYDIAASWAGEIHSILQTNDGVGPCPAVTYPGLDPKLGPVQDNGGPTQTMALLTGSPAIDTGFGSVCQDASTVNNKDQRGLSRPRGIGCDIGAYERVPANASLGTGYQTNVAVFRPSTGSWFVKNVLATSFGLSGDDPLPYDFNGDGVGDIAVYRPSTSAWYVKNQFATIFGLPSDVPVPGDYDGNGTADVAVYRPSTSAWYVKNQFATIFGIPGDIPVPGDYNGDGITDVAVFRPSTGAWYVKGQFSAIFGVAGDIPVPGDYNGDGTTDLAVYRPSTRAWYVRNQFSTVYGLAGDLPVPGDYDGNGTADIAVFRPSSSGWFVKGQFSTLYGLTGDYPLPAPDTNADGDPYQ